MKTAIISFAVAAVAVAALLFGTEPAEEHKLISPLPAGVDVNKLIDCTVPASFTADDFHWMGGNLWMTVYYKVLYDAVDISMMQEGDTLLYESEPVVIQKIERNDNGVEINGGLDNGGIWLTGNGGGTFIARTWDDHAVYSVLGKTEEALDTEWAIIDCGENPSDPVDTILSTQKGYIETLEGSRREFNYLNTKVTLVNGMITEINRHWIP